MPITFRSYLTIISVMIISFLSARPQSAYAISLTPTIALTFSADAQHRHSALLSALTCPSHQGMTTHVQVTRPRCLITTSTLPLCFPPYRSTTTYAYPFDSISLIYRITIRTGLFIIDRPLLLSTFLFILPIPF